MSLAIRETGFATVSAGCSYAINAWSVVRHLGQSLILSFETVLLFGVHFHQRHNVS